MKMTQQLDLDDDGGKLAEGLGHEPRLEPHVGIAHVTLDLRLGNQGRHRVDDQNIDGAATHQRLGDFQCLLSRIGLGNQEVVGLHPELAGVADVEGVFRVDEGGDPSQFLGFRDDMQGQGRFPRGFRTEYLDDPASRNPAHPSAMSSESEPVGMAAMSGSGCVVAQPHDGALAELFFDLTEG